MEFGLYVKNFTICFIILLFSEISISECKINTVCPKPLKKFVEKFGCDQIKCITSFTADNCTKNVSSVYEEKLTFCGCCPGCAKYIDYNPENPTDKCDTNFDSNPLNLIYEDCDNLYCPVIKNCKPGLICNSTSALCELPPAPYSQCKDRCLLQKAVSEIKSSSWSWTPRCTADGYFEPMQRKGVRNQGDCFCVDECGQRIFGRSRWGNDNCANQTCACSRQVHKLQTIQGRIATLHCTEDGNYEPLQCDTDTSLCYCVDPKSGRVMGDVLPEHQFKNLPCYDPTALNFVDNANYLRRCESEKSAGQKISIEANLHGLQYAIRELDCDADGSFKPLHKDRAEAREVCVDKDGTQIKDYFRQLRTTNDMNCRCARDILYFAFLGIQNSKICEKGTGNYEQSYFFGDIAQCVDLDGYQFGTRVPADYGCCLIIVDGANTCGDTAAQAQCKNYKQCSEYLFARE